MGTAVDLKVSNGELPSLCSGEVVGCGELAGTAGDCKSRLLATGSRF